MQFSWSEVRRRAPPASMQYNGLWPDIERYVSKAALLTIKLSTSSAIIAARVGDWAATHAMGDDALQLNVRSVIEGALSEYFRFLTCDDSLLVFRHSASDRSVMLLMLPARQRHWRVAYKSKALASDVTSVTLGRLLDFARNIHSRETAEACPGWSHTREDLPLNAFVCSERQTPFSVRLTECFRVMHPLPQQRLCPPIRPLEELADACHDLPDIRARSALERIAAWCDPALGELVVEDPGVRVREYNFAASGQTPDSRINRFRWGRSFPALWGLRNQPDLRALIDAGQPFIKPAASLLDCSASAIRRLRLVEHSVADLRFQDGQRQDIGIQYLDQEQPAHRTGRHPEWVGLLDVPLLLLDALAGLPVDKLPPLESLASMDAAIQGGSCPDAPVRSVIRSSLHAARLLTEERPGIVNPIFPAFRPLLASTKADWDSVARQVQDLARVDLLGIRDFVHMLADTLVLPCLLRLNEVRNQAEVDDVLLSSARGQMALVLAARWHIGIFLRQSLQWHRSLGATEDADTEEWRNDYQWPAWFKPIRTSKGVVVRPLCSAAALREEGASMHHCVGGYVKQCMGGWTQIFSLRTARGQRLSTLQLSARIVNLGKPWFIEVQNLAAHNKPPPNAAVAAATELLAALNQGKLPCRVGPSQSGRPAAVAHALCGFDHWNDTAWDRARAAAIPFLPSDLQRLAPMELGAAVAAFRLKPRCEQPELNETNDDHEDFEKRVLRWIR